MVGESSSGSPCLADEVYDNPNPSWAFPSMFPFLWPRCGLCVMPAGSLLSHISRRTLVPETCSGSVWPAEDAGGGILAGRTDSQLNSSALASWPCGFPLIVHGKGRAHSRRPRPCKGFCPFPPLPLWGAGNSKCGGEEQGSSLCHFTRFVTLHKLFFNCSFLICKHEIMILRPQTIGTR